MTTHITVAAEVFEVGSRAHYTFNGDSYPVTITKVGKARIEAREDKRVQLISGDYEWQPNPEGELKVFTRRTYVDTTCVGPTRIVTRWRSKGHGTWRLHLGTKSETNPCF